MDGLRTYGAAPFSVVAVHGGPGAVGDMAPVARRIGEYRGCVETLHTACSVEGQVDELRRAIASRAHGPVSLLGHSWGAWLVFIFAARYPEVVSKAILVGSGPFDAQYAPEIMRTRLGRLSAEERAEVQALVREWTDNSGAGRHTLVRIGQLFAKADAYDPIDLEEEVDVRGDVFESVWPEANALRESGELLRLGSSIACPVVAIHGDHDPHPAAGVREPLAKVVRQFEFILLSKCGHKPWAERTAQELFYRILREQLS